MRPGPQFPPALQKWLQRLFAHQTQTGESDPTLQKQTHTYLRHWVQQWVKTGELWQRNWEQAPLPTPEEIRRNLLPGSLSGATGFGMAGGKGAAMSKGFGANDATLPKAAGKGLMGMPGVPISSRLGFSGQPGEAGKRGKSPTARSRSRDRSGRRQRSRSARRRRQRLASSSRSRSQSRGRRRREGDGRSNSSESDERRLSKGWWGKGKGKMKVGKFDADAGGYDGKDGKKGGGTFDDLRERVRAALNGRLEAADMRGRHKELQEELQKAFGISTKRFRSFFGMTMSQYVSTFHAGGAEAANAATGGKSVQAQLRAGPKVLTQGEQDMRAQRANRFQSHLVPERAPVAMVSFNDSEVPALDRGPIIGELSGMCSREEAKEREMTRQLDKFEWKSGTDPKHPEVNLTWAVKKYQRSSADKAYRSTDVRTLDACWKTMEYLMGELLNFDTSPKPGYAVQSVNYIDVYSFLRDRTRAIRVDLHLQQPRSTTQRCFAEAHECCLRFEMLSLFLLQGGGSGSTEKYDEKLGLKSISQTIEPLLNAYQAAQEKQLAKSILKEAMGDLLDDGDAEEDCCSKWEMAVHRYIILLLMAFSPDQLLTHLAKLSKEVLSHPLVSFATQVFAAFNTDDYGRFLRLYREADFLTAVAMSGVADLARLRALWLLVRTYPQPIGDKIPLSRMKTFLAFTSDHHARCFLIFHGIQIKDDPNSEGGGFVVLPKKGTPEAAAHPILTGPAKLPEQCSFPKGSDSCLVSKFEALGMRRADIVFGAADPVVEAEAETNPEVIDLAQQDGSAAMEVEAKDGDGQQASSSKASGKLDTSVADSADGSAGAAAEASVPGDACLSKAASGGAT